MPKHVTRLRALRRAHVHRGRARTLSQAQIASALRVSQQTYSKYESGVIDPPEPTKKRIARVLGVDVDQLWPAAGPKEATA